MIKKLMLQHVVGGIYSPAVFRNKGIPYTAFAVMNSNNMDMSHKTSKEFSTALKSAQISRVRQVTGTLPMETAWEQLWREGVAPWDNEEITPVVAQLLEENRVRDGRVLVPGCGAGYDAVAMASPKRHVIGLDISKTALEKAEAFKLTSPNANFVEFQNEDFFTYTPMFQFDVIFDYTFFCALDPSLRPQWASKIAELLGLDGELITLMFPLDNHEGGPPYSVSLEAYEKVLCPWGFQMLSREDDIPSVGNRKGVESLTRWGRTVSKG